MEESIVKPTAKLARALTLGANADKAMPAAHMHSKVGK
jgi:hypothetical protein